MQGDNGEVMPIILAGNTDKKSFSGSNQPVEDQKQQSIKPDG